MLTRFVPMVFPRGDKIFFVEVDKNNIQCMTYDTELAEYVLFLT